MSLLGDLNQASTRPEEDPLMDKKTEKGLEKTLERLRRLLGDDGPGLVPAEALAVEQEAHQLGRGERRVRVVHLDGHLLGELGPVDGGALWATVQESLYDVLKIKRGGKDVETCWVSL